MSLKFIKRNTYPLLASISLTGIVASTYFYFTHAPSLTNKRTFDLAVPMRDNITGKRFTEMRKIPLMSEEEVERRLRLVARSGEVVSSGVNQGNSGNQGDLDGAAVWKWRWNTAQVGANSPVEDAWASVVVRRDPRTTTSQTDQPLETEAGATKDTEPTSSLITPVDANTASSNTKDDLLLFFTVLDGHAGSHTSRLLSKTLIPAVGLELSYLMNQPIPEFNNKNESTTTPSVLSYFKPYLPVSFFNSEIGKGVGNNTPRYQYLDQDPFFVSLAIQSAFNTLDAELTSAPIRLMNAALAEAESSSSSSSETQTVAQSLLRSNPLAQTAAKAALTGSCALLALLDLGARNMYVACTGDSRAVAGYFDAETREWSVEVLSEDQTAKNENEVKRIQSEHPPDELETVIKRGRVLGGLEPSRAFGDARYKWPRELQERISRMFFSETDTGLPRRPPANLRTPPYVTAHPVVTYRTQFIPASSPSPASASSSSPKNSTTNKTMRFVILATDGLWDMISSRDACALVAGHLSGMRGVLPKDEVIRKLGVSVAPGAAGVDGKGEAVKERRDTESAGAGAASWIFNEENLATHLVRNALGKGADTMRLREMMSIPPPLARSYRDDTTVTVIWWEEGKEGEKVEVKAKL